MKKSLIWFALSVALFSFVLSLPMIASAEEGDVGYSVRAILPENQIENGHSYFNLRVKPNDQQLLETEIFNHEAKPITVHLSVRNSSTNENGLIVYEDMEKHWDDDVLQLTEVLQFREETVVVPPKGSIKAFAELQMPDQPFDGVILGGLHFEKEADDKRTEGVSIQNRYAYVIGVVLSQSDKEIPIDLQLKGVRAELVNHRTANVITLENRSPNIVEGLAIDAKIYQSDKTEPVKEKMKEQISMAPYTTIDFVIDWDNQKLEPGSYTAVVEAKVETSRWNWEESFTIEENEAATINKEAVKLEDDKVNLNGFVLTSTSILLIIIITLLIYIRKLKKAQES